MRYSRHLLFSFLFITAIFFQASAQVNHYAADWKLFEIYSQKNLPKSALEVVKKIYAKAKRDHQDAQLIKSLVAMIDMQRENTENNEIAAFLDFDKEISTAAEPTRSILQSLQAKMYWNYFQSHRYLLYNRTNTSGFKKDDPATWTIDDFHKKISSLFLASIKNSSLLQSTPLTAYDDIIIKGNVRHLRATLYDLLSHEALDYFKSDEQSITKPAYAFTIEKNEAFAPAAEFARASFSTKDSLSLQQKALLVLQQLIQFHLHDAMPGALIDVDIERIQFVYEKATMENKKALYRKALIDLGEKYGSLPAASEAFYLLAASYNADGAQYSANGDTSHRWDRRTAKEICERVLQQKDSSEGKINCYNLLHEITAKESSFEVEKVNLPGQPYRVFVKYRNVPTLYLRIIKAERSQTDRFNENFSEADWQLLINAKSFQSWSQNLPDPGDYQRHGVEIKADALPVGEYVLLTSDNNEFNLKKGRLSARRIYVSSISFVNEQWDYFVLNRETGQPIANAQVTAWYNQYDQKQSKYVKQKQGIYKTDTRGYFHLKKDISKTNVSSYFLEITAQGEHFFMQEGEELYDSQDSDTGSREVTSVFLFTDRSIYRPGQALYFKGIAVKKISNQRQNDIAINYTSWIYLRDANQQYVDSMKVTTNDYGSFSGKFNLPSSGLNGQFSLWMKDESGQEYFSVEEYKRPSYLVTIDKPIGSYEINDRITITGNAKGYAGNNIDGAKVKYRVVRQSRFIYAYYFSKYFMPRSTQQEIASGEIKTSKDGKFNISFTAIPDATLDPKMNPVFDYHIYADVTDVGGETRSAESFVAVSYRSLLLTMNIPAKMPLDSFTSLMISTTNLGGDYQQVGLEVSVTKLKDEQRLIRPRYWERPDQFVMTRNEYIRIFPVDEYDRETDFSTWEKDLAFTNSRRDSSRENGRFTILQKPNLPGMYKIVVRTRDTKGREVGDTSFTELYDDKNNGTPIPPQYLWAKGSKPVEPFQSTSQVIGSSAKNVYIIQVVKNYMGVIYKTENLSGEKKEFSFTPTEKDRGGFGVNYFFVKDNRVFHFEDVVQVPWTNKELKIEYLSFRDKTLPGSEEKWKLRISGTKNEKVNAEVLASMYDASLDQFRPHKWTMAGLWPNYYSPTPSITTGNFEAIQSEERELNSYEGKDLVKQYDELILFNHSLLNILYKGERLQLNAGIGTFAQTARKEKEYDVTTFYSPIKDGDGKLDTLNLSSAEKNNKPTTAIQPRTNFNETAFFFPELHTDSTGAVEFSFTMPEALTTWKLQTLAHTRDLAFALSEKEVITQKELMVQTNAPRFLREGDHIEFSARIVNMTGQEMTGTAELQLFDAATNEPVDGQFQNMYPNQYFTVGAGQTEAVKFPIQVPFQFNKALTWRIIARSGDHSDGEENILPILSSRILVTETLPINMRGSGTKNFSFDKLLNSGESETLHSYNLAVEYTSNPSWYAVQALPFLMEYPYECAEQTWNRFYANALAASIVNAAPRIRQVFEQWKTKDTAAFLSNLQKNQELKSILLEETPWVLEGKTEAAQKKNIALLFDMVKMSSELDKALAKLKDMQASNGGFVWFKGGPDDRYITQYILSGIGHLKKLNAWPAAQDAALKQIANAALAYLDKKIKSDYDALVKSKTILKNYIPGSIEIQYLYMRSFYPATPVSKSAQPAYEYFRKQAQTFWTKESKYEEGMIALVLSRTGDAKTPAVILRSLKETAIVNPELGMYWKDQTSYGWSWNQAPIEMQSLMIETFSEVGKDTRTVDDLRTWLLKNKQTNSWKTTRATAEACYALLLQGSNWLNEAPAVSIQLGDKTVSSTDGLIEAGTGDLKKSFDEEKITPEMGKISVTVTAKPGETSTQTTWGAVYWQYFENMDKITSSATPLKLVKKLFIEKNGDRGPVLTPVKDGDELHPGDKIKVRIELRVDREMEYVHMKDLRASAFEPVNVLSEYKYQGGLGYYESTRDASTDFFFSYLPKGTFVFEYSLFVTHTGSFSNGITSIECMYAPEFGSHSEGVRVNVAGE
jgi:hypothetical protein